MLAAIRSLVLGKTDAVALGEAAGRILEHPRVVEGALVRIEVGILPPRAEAPRARAENAEGLITELDAIFATKTRAEWGAIFDAEEDLWWAPVQSIDDVIQDPQVAAAGGFVEVPDGETTATLPATPVDFGGTPWAPRAMAPEHGQHTEEILTQTFDLGLNIDRIICASGSAMSRNASSVGSS